MRRCPNCMREMADESCASCGYPEVKQAKINGAMEAGSLLCSRFELGCAKTDSFQSIAYIAWDIKQEQPVLITEFFPRNQAVRKNGRVSPRRFPELYRQAVLTYTESRRDMPLPLVMGFEENGTAYRVYSLPDGMERLAENAERLMDSPVYFRDHDGQPLMNVCALQIPDMPDERPWRLTEMDNTTITEDLPKRSAAKAAAEAGPIGKKKKTGLIVGGAAVMAVLLGTAGFIVFSMLKEHPISIRIRTDTPIRTVALDDSQHPAVLLAPATPNADGWVAYDVKLTNGTYTLTADGENGMSIPPYTVDVLSGVREFEVSMPTPSPTPVPQIRPAEEEWIYSPDNAHYYLIARGGEPREAVGRPEMPLKSYRLVLKNAGALPREELSFLIGHDAQGDGAVKRIAPEDWKVSGNGYELRFFASADDCALLVEAPSGGRAAVASLKPGETANIDSVEAIQWWKDHLSDNAVEYLLFVGDQNSLGEAELIPEKLMNWSGSHKELYSSFPLKRLTVRLDDRVAADAEVTIDGLHWEKGMDVYLAGQVSALPVTLQKEGVYADESVAPDSGPVILGKSAADASVAEWEGVSQLIDIDGQIIPQVDGKFDVSKAEALRKSRVLFPRTLKAQEEKLQKLELILSAEDVDPERVTRVALDDILLAGNASDEQGYRIPLRATGGTAECRVDFDNGHTEKERVTLQGSEGKVYLLREANGHLTEMLKNVRGLIRIKTEAGDATRFVMNDDTLAEEYRLGDGRIVKPDELAGLTAVFKADEDSEARQIVPVVIRPDERIMPDAVQAVDLLGEPVWNGSEITLTGLTPGDYSLKILVKGEQAPIYQSMTVRADGPNECVLLKRQADDAVNALSWWGIDGEPLRQLGESAVYLKQEAVDRAREEYEKKLIAVPVSLPQTEKITWRVSDAANDTLPIRDGQILRLPAGTYSLTASLGELSARSDPFALDQGRRLKADEPQVAGWFCRELGFARENCILLKLGEGDWKLYDQDGRSMEETVPEGLAELMAAAAAAQGEMAEVTILPHSNGMADDLMLYSTLYLNDDDPDDDPDIKVQLQRDYNADLKELVGKMIPLGLSNGPVSMRTNARSQRFAAVIEDTRSKVYVSKTVTVNPLQSYTLYTIESTGADVVTRPTVPPETPPPTPKATPSEMPETTAPPSTEPTPTKETTAPPSTEPTPTKETTAPPSTEPTPTKETTAPQPTEPTPTKETTAPPPTEPTPTKETTAPPPTEPMPTKETNEMK